MVITGDPLQHDRGFEVNGLLDLIQRVRGRPDVGLASDIQVVEFKPEDVQRHAVIRKILKLYS
jgi:phosphate starvation-inducible protein PhoH